MSRAGPSGTSRKKPRRDYLEGRLRGRDLREIVCAAVNGQPKKKKVKKGGQKTSNEGNRPERKELRIEKS